MGSLRDLGGWSECLLPNFPFASPMMTEMKCSSDVGSTATRRFKCLASRWLFKDSKSFVQQQHRICGYSNETPFFAPVASCNYNVESHIWPMIGNLKSVSLTSQLSRSVSNEISRRINTQKICDALATLYLICYEAIIENLICDGTNRLGTDDYGVLVRNGLDYVSRWIWIR